MALKPGRELIIQRELVSAPGTYGNLCKFQERSLGLAPNAIDTTGLDCTDPSGTPVTRTSEPGAIDRALTFTLLLDTAHEAVREMIKDAEEGRVGTYKVIWTGVAQWVGTYMVSFTLNAPVEEYQSASVTVAPTGTPTRTYLGPFA